MKSYDARPPPLIVVGFFVALAHAVVTVSLFGMCVPRFDQQLHWSAQIGQVALAFLMFPLGWLDLLLARLDSPVVGFSWLQSPLIGVAAALFIRSRRPARRGRQVSTGVGLAQEVR